MVKNKKKLKKVIIYSNILFLQVDFLNFPYSLAKKRKNLFFREGC